MPHSHKEHKSCVKATWKARGGAAHRSHLHGCTAPWSLGVQDLHVGNTQRDALKDPRPSSNSRDLSPS